MTIEIPLTQGKVALIDDEDYSLVSQYKWCLTRTSNNKKFYALTWAKGKLITMHRLLLGVPDGYESDHINSDGLDNRRSNLRIVTLAQNQMNKKKQKNSSSIYKGVCRDKNRNKWYASIKINNIAHFLGRYENEVEAARAYDDAAKKYFGEYARLNLIE